MLKVAILLIFAFGLSNASEDKFKIFSKLTSVYDAASSETTTYYTVLEKKVKGI